MVWGDVLDEAVKGIDNFKNKVSFGDCYDRLLQSCRAETPGCEERHVASAMIEAQNRLFDNKAPGYDDDTLTELYLEITKALRDSDDAVGARAIWFLKDWPSSQDARRVVACVLRDECGEARGIIDGLRPSDLATALDEFLNGPEPDPISTPT